ncbi:MAG: UDP-N-acetylglucosamine 2-epimerase (non-hydrolyzing) [Candidatus Bathyarchaeia archaeon]
MKPIMIVAGTRPEIIKLYPVIKWFKEFNVDYLFIWSGQHYDYLLSRVFFKELGLPKINADLHVGSGSQGVQTAGILVRLERIIREYDPSIVVAEGDTNTVLAGALASVKCYIPFAHVEAGLRCWNMKMPEEVNRRVADALAGIHFAPSELAALNLLFEGISRGSIHVTGNTIVDVIHEFKDRASDFAGNLLTKFNLKRGEFLLITLHRVENVDNPVRLRAVIEALSKLSNYYQIVFPLHPRTRNILTNLKMLDYLARRIKLIEPLGYFEFLALLLNCRVVLTDSGGVQEEAFSLKVPTVTLRYNTERPETTIFDVNMLAGAEKEKIVELTLKQARRYDEIRKLDVKNPLGDGLAGKRIAQLLKESAEGNVAIKEPDLRETPVIEYRLLDKERNLEGTLLFDMLASFDNNGKPTLQNIGGSKFLARIKGKFR